MDRETQYAMVNTHSWEAGCMVAHPEDLWAGEYRARKVECGRCEDVYPPDRPCPEAGAVTLELWGFAPTTDMP